VSAGRHLTNPVTVAAPPATMQGIDFHEIEVLAQALLSLYL
jgi:hypothetical protein